MNKCYITFEEAKMWAVELDWAKLRLFGEKVFDIFGFVQYLGKFEPTLAKVFCYLCKFSVLYLNGQTFKII